ncbi:glycosyltransferase [Salinibacter ruber]|uniref:glycosyltransferase n=1 Tax=Salinibacter ruber TaxID=146919 RepID=UPI00311AAA36
MNPFTGGCHYNMGCRRFEDSCGKCPQLGSFKENDLSRYIWDYKNSAYQKAIQKNQLSVVATSEWMMDEAKRSALLSDAQIQLIPYGLDHEVFQPRDTSGMRTALGVPEENLIVLFVAESIRNQRKGFDLLAKALSGISEENVTLISVGGQENNIQFEKSHYHLGTIESNELLSVFYSLADIFVIPSRQEAFGQTALESMASGTPVVGFNTGGIPDMVRPGETGWLAETGNARALRQAIERALSHEIERERRGRRCREVVEKEYTLATQAKAYRRLYEKTISKNAA